MASTGCPSAVNRSPLSLAAWRPRSSARDRATRHWVRTLWCWPALPLARALPSPTAAGAAWAGWVCLASGSLCAVASVGLWHGPTPGVRASWSCPWGAPGGPCSDGQGQTQGLPSPAPNVAVPARGLRPRQVRGRLALVACPLWPSACAERVGTQDEPDCGAPYPAGTFPCQRFTDPVTEARA